MFLFSSAFAALVCLADVQTAINNYVSQYIDPGAMSVLHQQNQKFGPDYLLALAVAVNMFSFYSIGKKHTLFKGKLEKVVRYASSHTFSLYLYHAPILFFMSAVAPYEAHPFINVISCTVLPILLIILLGRLTEKRKYVYKAIFYRMVDVFRPSRIKRA